MKIEVGYAETQEQLEGVYRLRYDVYVDEMNLYTEVADHEKKHLVRSYDKTGRIVYATIDGRYAGTVVINWGGDAKFEEDPDAMELYGLAPFLEVVPDEQIATASSMMVRPEYRGSGLLFRLLGVIADFSNRHGVQLNFVECRPHLLNLYRKLGFRSYSETKHHQQMGLMVPLCLVIEDLDYLVSIDSPLLAFKDARTFESDVPRLVAPLLPATGVAAPKTPDQQAAEWTRTYSILSRESDDAVGIFEGLDEGVVARLLDDSNVIACKRGDAVISKGSTDRTIFVVLEGSVEVREGERVLVVLSEGEVVGELTYLLNTERLTDVYAATDGARVLALSQSTLGKLAQEEASVAARLYENLAKIVAMRMVSLHRGTFATAG